MLDPTAPTAQLAERLYAHWEERWQSQPPMLALIPEARQAAFLEALRRRVEKAEPVAVLAEDLRSAIRQLTDRGACLIMGGQESRPALLNNLSLSSALLSALTAPLPILALGTLEENPLDRETGPSDFAPKIFGVHGLAANE